MAIKLLQRAVSELNILTTATFGFNVKNMALKLSTQPPLPLPKLLSTLNKFLVSAKPFLTEEELTKSEKILNEFGAVGGYGEKLQHLLEKKAEKEKNWLEKWWINSAYFEFRLPVVYYSSPGLVFPPHPFQSKLSQLEYASKVAVAAVNYKLEIDNNTIPVEKIGDVPIDMTQYKKIFGTCRIPEPDRDNLYFEEPPKSAQHIIVAYQNQFFSVPVLSKKNQSVIPEKKLLSQLLKIVEETELNGSNSPAIGILTSDHRDNWATAYKKICEDPKNKSNIEEIQKSLFLLCIDQPFRPNKSVNDMTHGAHLCTHGGGPDFNGANRWFDKTIQFIVGPEGNVGLTYEHSPAEGAPIAVMVDYLMNYLYGKKVSENSEDISLFEDFKKLHFTISEAEKQSIESAKLNLQKLVSEVDYSCFSFNGFGKEAIKLLKLSPDSFIQMAIQLAFYRIHKTPGAHYESASTRKFHHGRTETIRSCSVESVNMAKTFLDPQASNQDKIKAIKTAVNAHKEYTVQAMNGCGVDRHLLGLKKIALENNLPIPKIFEDPSFTRSSNMRISTSQVATKCDGFMCYGPLTQDGYGCCYNPRANNINFSISTFSSHPETNAKNFEQALILSLMEMYYVLRHSITSKL